MKNADKSSETTSFIESGKALMIYGSFNLIIENHDGKWHDSIHRLIYFKKIQFNCKTIFSQKYIKNADYWSLLEGTFNVIAWFDEQIDISDLMH